MGVFGEARMLSCLKPDMLEVATDCYRECGASGDKFKVTDFVFANTGLLLSDSMKVLVMVLEVLHEKAKPLVLKIF